MTTPNLNLKTNFLGCGPYLEATLRQNFEAVDAAFADTDPGADDRYLASLKSIYLGTGPNLASALRSDFEKVAILIEDPEAEVSFNEIYLGAGPHLEADLRANFRLIAEGFANREEEEPEPETWLSFNLTTGVEHLYVIDEHGEIDREPNSEYPLQLVEEDIETGVLSITFAGDCTDFFDTVGSLDVDGIEFAMIDAVFSEPNTTVTFSTGSPETQAIEFSTTYALEFLTLQ